MPCGKRPLVKTWDKPRNIRVAKPSVYQQNEASVKLHWKKVMRDLELSYKDEQFWETQARSVRDLVGPVIFERLTKIFNLPMLDKPYQPASEMSIILPSEQFYITAVQPSKTSGQLRPSLYSVSDFGSVEMGEEGEEEESLSDGDWSASTFKEESLHEVKSRKSTKSKLGFRSKTAVRSTRSLATSMQKVTATSKSLIMSKMFHRLVDRSFSAKYLDKGSDMSTVSSAFSDDDVLVHPKSRKQRSMRLKTGELYNPHFELLYCTESETDMIKWESKFKKKSFEVSASDECSKKAELLTKHIANEFYEWWIGVGSADYKSEIKCPGDLESLFQIWFDEHASRGLVLDPKILPCVLQTIANYVGVPQASCPRALKRQIAWDIHAETSPAHTRAFNSSLPLKAKHIPPQNKTAETWKAIQIPEDLKSMTAVWGDISHLTSTKAFSKWLQQRPYMPMPPCLKELEQPGEKKHLFVVPSDFVVREEKSDSTFSTHDLNIPVSEFSLEIKEVLSRLLRD